METNDRKFRIGLCLAGAVSAGAYTAGVMDYLIQSLDEWQRRKDRKEPDTPSHNVEISIIGGASAGGMTGIIAASILNHEIFPVSKANTDLLSPISENRFYHTWVDLAGADTINQMLDPSDIAKGKINSLINSGFIDRIATSALSAPKSTPFDRGYLPKNLKVFVTVSNLEGMSFSLNFTSSGGKISNRYRVTSHRDFVCFKICKEQAEYSNDGWIPINFETGLNLNIVKAATLGTGAFPLALAARTLSRDYQYMRDLKWFKEITVNNPDIFVPATAESQYQTVNVDGGMIDNEPFGKIREELLEIELGGPSAGGVSKDQLNNMLEKNQDHNTSKCTVLMIDPFPSEGQSFDAGLGIETIAGNTLEAMIDQARIKPSDLIDAMNSNKFGQFMISPVRYVQGADGISHPIDGAMAIACGAMGGFSGFLNKEFRIHDFFLGRANCEKFLRDYFVFPKDTQNPIFKSGYLNVKNSTSFEDSSKSKLQIIPIFNAASPKPYLPVFSNGKDWPTTSAKKIEDLKPLIKKRVQKILLNISNYSGLDHLLIWIGAQVVLNQKIANSTIKTILESLQRHKLLQ